MSTALLPSAADFAGVFVAGTDTAVGKTRVSVGLLGALRMRGWDAVGMKPVAAGCDADGTYDDVARLRAASGPTLPTNDARDMNPYAFARPVSPHLEAQRCGTVIEVPRIAAAYRRLAHRHEAVIVEGAGGWYAPIGPQATMADIAKALELPVLLVVGLRLGCLSHALLSCEAVAHAGLAIAGWVGSLIDPQMSALDENIATLASRLPGIPWALLPFAADRQRDAHHLQALAAQLAGPASSH